MGAVQHRQSVRRHPSRSIEPERSPGLLPGHAALSEARTIFPSTVTASKDSPRFLVSGHNNPKLGKTVLKGPRAGWPIYQLSLEERATCPRSCEQWSTCYGNAMHLARRHTPDADFLRFLIAEVTTLCRSHPEGLLIRLHTLGDFYSVEYVYVWASLISQFPQLHVFGYTARRIGDPDPETDAIARAIDVLTTGAWNRFAIRTSGTRSLARSRSIVVDADPQEPDVIVCPAQTEATEACASCGLCWASSARDKTIAFLKHGMKTRGPAIPKAANDEEPVIATPKAKVIPNRLPKSPSTVALIERVYGYLQERGEPLTGAEIAEHLSTDYAGVTKACATLYEDGRAKWAWGPIKDGRKKKLLFPLSLARAAPASAPSQPAAKPPSVIPIRTKVNRPLEAPSADDLTETVQGAAPRSLNARKAGQCAYPTNSPAVGHGAETTYCCEPVMGKLQYCADHAKRMFAGVRK